MNYKKLTTLIASIALVGFVAATGETVFAQREANEAQARPVNPGGIVVDDDNQCPGTDFATIQAAVNASPVGSTIQVCPGVYPEQVRINKRLTVVGVEFNNQNQARIQPTAAVANTTSLFDGSPIAAVVVVDGAARVTLENLTIDGAGSLNACSPIFVGVFYRNSTGTIEAAAVRNIIANGGGCGNGIGIFAQSGGGRRTNLAVTNSSVHDYDKVGIAGNEVGTTLTATGNQVAGRGVVGDTAQNGIQIAFGASGVIEQNSVINNNFSLCVSAQNCPNAAVNIIVVDSNDVRVRANTAGKSQVNIYAQGDRTEVNGNTVQDSDVFDGIVLIGNGGDARANRIFNSDRAGITVSGSSNRVRSNFVNEAQIGVQVTDGDSNNIGGNTFFNTAINTTTGAATRNSTAAAPARISAVRF